MLMKTKTRLKIKNRSHIIDTAEIGPGLDMDTDMLNIKCVSVQSWLNVLSNT